MRRLLLIAGLLLVAGRARAEEPPDPRYAISFHLAVVPGVGGPIVPISTQFIAHLTPRLAGAFEPGSYFYYVLPVLPYLQLGPRFYVIPPRARSLAPFVSAKGGGGFWWLCFDCSGEEHVHWLLMGTASAGVEIVTGGSPANPPFFFTLEGGATWIGTGGEKIFAGPLYFGRVGAGARF